jgi:hypothetical protein
VSNTVHAGVSHDAAIRESFKLQQYSLIVRVRDVVPGGYYGDCQWECMPGHFASDTHRKRIYQVSPRGRPGCRRQTAFRCPFL